MKTESDPGLAFLAGGEAAAVQTEAPTNSPSLSVGELSRDIKRTLEGGFGHVRVRGEVSGAKRAASGHWYFRLKDDKAVIDAVCWRGSANRLNTPPEDGLEVIATGRVTTYEGRSVYQLVVEQLEPAGAGALLKLLEERRKKLGAEGLFDEDRKRALPYLPERIGVVTSPTGAVIRDILHRLADRFPRHVLVAPVRVQGEGSAEEIAAAIQAMNTLEGNLRPDVLIVARGGGSLEDLWAFNEEVVVRAAAASAIPLISAVGHETDTTLIDYATLPSPMRQLEAKHDGLRQRSGALDRAAAKALRDHAHALERLDPARRLANASQRGIQNAGTRLASAAGLLDSYSYEKTLDRGFVLVRAGDAVISTAEAATPGLAVELQFAKGERRAAVIGDGAPPAKRAAPPPKSKKKQKPRPSDDSQGSLL